MKTIVKILCVGLVLTASALTSCTDYQDEIDALDNRVTILEDLVGKANSNIDAMQTLVNAMADGWVITGMVEVDPAHDPDGRGYRTITFGKIDPETGELSNRPEDKKVTTIYNGLDGEKGDNGTDAKAPNITLKKDPTDGNYYWVVDGNWLINPEDGKRIQANGNDGEKGDKGDKGDDGKTPKLRINANDEWEVSYDDGESWNQLLDANGDPISAKGDKGATGQQGPKGDNAFAFIKSVKINVEQGNRYVIFTLYDGTEITLPLSD